MDCARAKDDIRHRLLRSRSEFVQKMVKSPHEVDRRHCAGRRSPSLSRSHDTACAPQFNDVHVVFLAGLIGFDLARTPTSETGS